ncbi:MAG: hypothetical protein AB2L14_21605 [Candidatus Xenobiia bacterium LiM19]
MRYEKWQLSLMVIILLSTVVTVPGCQYDGSSYTNGENCVIESSIEMNRDGTASSPETASPAPLKVPALLSAAQSPNRTISLCWENSADDAEGFIIERAVEPESTWSVAAFVAKNITEYEDMDISSGTEYRYRIRTYCKSVTSLPSREIIVTTNLQTCQ